MAISHKHQLYKYSDYISPLPADELVKVALKKQSLYDEGVGKIDKRIEELNQYGLSIRKAQDQEYFNREMSKFINAVNESSAKTDFSNMANVRNILSIGKPLENDPNIINAIQGSAEITRRQKLLASLKPEERAAANDFDFMKDAYDYLSDGKVGSKISNAGRSYTPYRDLSKKFTEVFSKIKPSTISVPTMSPDGKWIIQTKTEGVDAAKLREAFEATLDEADKNQLRIDTRYDMHARGKDNIIQEYKATNEYYSAQTSQAIESSKLELDKLNSRYARVKDPATLQNIEEAKKRINELEIRRNIFANNATKTVDQISEEEIVGFHKNQFISNLANAYAYKSQETTIKEDPYHMEQVKFSHDIALKNIDKMNAIEAEERKMINERFKDMRFVTSGSGFTSLFAPMLPGKGEASAYLTKITSDAGKNYLVDPKQVARWEQVQEKYDRATTPLAKMIHLRELLQLRYDSPALLEQSEDFNKKSANFEELIKQAKDAGNTKKVKELEDQQAKYASNIILQTQKEKDRLYENLGDLITSYKEIQKYSDNPYAKIRLVFPGSRQVEELSINDFLTRPLDQLMQYAGKVELYDGTVKQKLESITTMNNLFKEYGEGKPSVVQPGTDFKSFLESQRGGLPGLFEYQAP
jgi:hypothetical protein